MGANAALAYAGSGRTVDAVVAIAPGHIADLWREHPLISASVRKARDMIAEGRGDARANFDYIDQGTRLSVRTSAAIFLSYWDPDGLGAMPRSAAAIATPTPLLWVVGGADRISSLGPGYAFERAPPHSRSRYVEVAGGRYDTPDVAREEIGRWCSELLA
jgi:pimeloyl-ACP methyl ester carboxylesterase